MPIYGYHGPGSYGGFHPHMGMGFYRPHPGLLVLEGLARGTVAVGQGIGRAFSNVFSGGSGSGGKRGGGASGADGAIVIIIIGIIMIGMLKAAHGHWMSHGRLHGKSKRWQKLWAGIERHVDVKGHKLLFEASPSVVDDVDPCMKE